MSQHQHCLATDSDINGTTAGGGDGDSDHDKGGDNADTCLSSSGKGQRYGNADGPCSTLKLNFRRKTLHCRIKVECEMALLKQQIQR